MRLFAVALIFFGATASQAQTPQVPHKMHFAGMTLIIHDEAKREIQKDVDALTKSQKYFEMKVERAKTYFPLIEKVFAEERLPEDFKYLVLQESALVPDAVSVSNAVGFWQFKDFTAREMGMRVDELVDERMNIVAASRGAAKYLKQNNYYFNNWIYALQAYQMGAGGVQRSVSEDHHGVSKMEINSETYWYVKKYLAYKVAFENAVKGTPQIKVSALETNSKSVAELAAGAGVDEEVLRDFNKWIKGNKIPADRNYTVIIPGNNVAIQDFSKLVLSSAKAGKANPLPKDEKQLPVTDTRIQINGLWAAKPMPSETLVAFANRIKIKLSDLLKFNDIAIDHKLLPDEYYFIEKKKAKADVPMYTSKLGDDWWTISQHTGIQLAKLKKYNRKTEEPLKVGASIWLRKQESLLQETSEDVAELEKDGSFEWGITTEKLSQPTVIVSADTPAQKVKSDLMEVESTKEKFEAKTRPDETIIHEVKASDTIYSVARQYQVSIKQLMDWNGKSNFSIAVGEKLKILKR